jgi:mono/diheme cytochrome c family protein
MRRFILWGVGLVFVGLILAVVFVRGSGVTAAREPWPLEERVAKAGWRFLIPRDIRDASNPAPATPEVITEGLEHFADHCAVCHGNDGSGDTTIGRRTFPRAPDMRAQRTQSLTDGELFYAIERGIPWTAMPAWETGTPEGAEESWHLVRFIRHLPALTVEELTAMEKLNPKSAAELNRDRDIDEFLKGSGPATPKKGGHVHK